MQLEAIFAFFGRTSDVTSSPTISAYSLSFPGIPSLILTVKIANFSGI